MLIEMEFRNFDEYQENLVRHALAGLLQISPQSVRIVAKKQASVRLLVELPEDSAKALVEMHAKPTSDYKSWLNTLKFREMRISKERFLLTRITHRVECTIRDWSRNITVLCDLLLRVSDEAQLFIAGVGNLEEWIQAKVEEATQGALFSLTYLDVLLNFEPTGIKARVREEARKIGCEVPHMVVLLELEPLALREGFFIEHSTTYRTADPNVEVGVDIALSGRIRDLSNRKLRRYLTSPQDRISQAVKESLERVTRRVLHTIDPSQFFMNFHVPYAPEEYSVRDLLEANIKRYLEEHFGMEVTTLVIKPGKSDLSERYAALVESPRTVEVMARSFSGFEGEKDIQYRVSFRVSGVHDNGWHTWCTSGYESREKELERVEEVVRHNAREALETLPSEVLRYARSYSRQNLEKIFRGAIDRIAQTMGLAVSFLQLQRLPTHPEVALEAHRSVIAAREIVLQESSLRELRELHSRTAALLESNVDEDDPELLRLRKKIKEASEELRQDHVRLLPKDDGSVREDQDLEEFYKTKHLLEGEDQALCNDKDEDV